MQGGRLRPLHDFEAAEFKVSERVVMGANNQRYLIEDDLDLE